jgi:phosphoribosylglycinamide formyltransferase-1
VRLGVLASGNGTNLQAILDACRRRQIAGEVALVVCNVPGAQALARARSAGVPALEIDHRAFADRASFDLAIASALQERGVELVALAGFMRLLSPGFLSRFPGRVLNVHPSLLPAFPGLHAPRRALASGAHATGCTVHFVDEGMDTGPVLMQAKVPILPGDREQALVERIQQREHEIFPLCLDLVASGRTSLSGRELFLDGALVPAGGAELPALRAAG